MGAYKDTIRTDKYYFYAQVKLMLIKKLFFKLFDKALQNIKAVDFGYWADNRMSVKKIDTGE